MSEEKLAKTDVEDDKEKDIKDNDENLPNSIALLAKRFGKVMRRFDR